MAPTGRPREPSIERSSEYGSFITKLTAFHEARGTNFDPEPRVGSRHVDLFRLFNAVVARGGYDIVCTQKLAWRKLGQDFNLGTTNLPALAFSLKTCYYRYLAAYEIKTVHNKEPPPKEILEELSARGGDLLNRTLENYKPHGARELGTLANGEDSEGAGEEVDHRSPKPEKLDVEDVGSGGRYARGLRQAPPQRVLFQPDLTPSRAPRQTSVTSGSPQPMAQAAQPALNNSSNPLSNSFTVANYEPKPQVPLTLRPVITPGNNPNLFKERQRMLREARAAKEGRVTSNYKGLMLPGTGYEGPNIYLRTLQSLRSGVPGEQDYALYHLVKISHERGDKFRFDAFPGLAEGLVEKALEISSLFYDVEWHVSYSDDGKMHESYSLDGMNSTADILSRINSLGQLETRDGMETEDFSQRLIKVNEAALTLRNMAMLEENAEYLSRLYPVRDFLSIALNLPRRPSAVEIQHYALDIAEQLTKYYSLRAEDPLYTSLLGQLDSTDRGSILTSLRAISRISMHLEENNRLGGVPASMVQKISEWTLLEDEELAHACLDFLYQYTAMVDNVDSMVSQMSLDGLINQLVRLLLHGAKATEIRRMVKAPSKEQAAVEIPSLPKELLDQLLAYSEPERSAYWLRACFEEDAEADITQIALWQAYQSRFVEHQANNRALLPAAEFIKNISTTFVTASAQVLQGPTPKFIIKGIRPRHRPMNPRGQVYDRCLWRKGPGKVCDSFVATPKGMWEHLLGDHLRAPKRENSKWDFAGTSSRPYSCRWGECRRFQGKTTTSLYDIGMHVKTHLPDTSARAATRQRYNRTGGEDTAHEGEFESQLFYNTTVDERGDAAGIPLTSALVLRNLARNLPKVETKDAEGVGWTSKLFGPVEPQLWYVMAHNKPLAGYMADLTATISARP